ncbi:SbtR family transcriptional regulator [Williamsia sp. M5A3_1d]
METNIEAALQDSQGLTRDLSPRDALQESLIHLTWQLRIWHDLPFSIASAQRDPASPVNDACDPLATRTAALLGAAKSSGDVSASITADEVFELVTTLSWGVDRFHDDAATARRRVVVATAGIFT